MPTENLPLFIADPAAFEKRLAKKMQRNLEREAKKNKRDLAEALHKKFVEGLPEHRSFGKISRLNRDIIITEKLDGTNAAIGITEDGRVYAQSRTRIISPYDDNFGFAHWVEWNKKELIKLGPGLHFGEWWGKGINRGYGLDYNVFSLFNVIRWGNLDDKHEADIDILFDMSQKIRIDIVPILYVGPWYDHTGSIFAPDHALRMLREEGSFADDEFMNPEGIVVYHTKGDVLFKATLEGDAEYKGGKRDKDGNPVSPETIG